MIDSLYDFLSNALGHGATGAWFVRAFDEDGEKLFLYFLIGVATILALSIHEFGHAWMADKLGDPQPRKDGRVSLAPWSHFSPLGFMLMIASAVFGFPVGWGKYLKTDPETYNVPRKTGMALVALAGPLSSLLGAVTLALPARWLLAFLQERGGDLELWLLLTLAITFVTTAFTVVISVSLFVYNLLPLYPMDGAHVLATLLPDDLATVYVRLMKRYGMYIFLGLTGSGILNEFVTPIILWLFYLLMGV